MKIAGYKAFEGSEVGLSRWFSVDQKRIDEFAEVTEDRQAIHLDAAAAASSPFGTTIAHGFLVLSLVSAMLMELLPEFDDRGILINYGMDKVRFVTPVRAGSRVRGRFVLSGSNERPNGDYMTSFSVTIEVEGQSKPALVAEWLTLQRPAVPKKGQGDV